MKLTVHDPGESEDSWEISTVSMYELWIASCFMAIWTSTISDYETLDASKPCAEVNIVSSTLSDGDTVVFVS
jgi:hypothetical protein